MAKPKKFKTVTKNKYTSDDLQAIDSYQPREKNLAEKSYPSLFRKNLKLGLKIPLNT